MGGVQEMEKMIQGSVDEFRDCTFLFFAGKKACIPHLGPFRDGPLRIVAPCRSYGIGWYLLHDELGGSMDSATHDAPRRLCMYVMCLEEDLIVSSITRTSWNSSN